MGLGPSHDDDDFFVDQMQRQRSELAMQDEHLDELHASVKRLGDITLHITGEIEDQNRLIDDLDKEVEDAASGMSLATQRTKKFIEDHGGNTWCCMVMCLFALLCVLTFLVLFT